MAYPYSITVTVEFTMDSYALTESDRQEVTRAVKAAGTRAAVAALGEIGDRHVRAAQRDTARRHLLDRYDFGTPDSAAASDA